MPPCWGLTRSGASHTQQTWDLPARLLRCSCWEAPSPACGTLLSCPVLCPSPMGPPRLPVGPGQCMPGAKMSPALPRLGALQLCSACAVWFLEPGEVATVWSVPWSRARALDEPHWLGRGIPDAPGLGVSVTLCPAPQRTQALPLPSSRDIPVPIPALAVKAGLMSTELCPTILSVWRSSGSPPLLPHTFPSPVGPGWGCTPWRTPKARRGGASH